MSRSQRKGMLMQRKRWEHVLGPMKNPWKWNEVQCNSPWCCDKEPNRKKEPLPIDVELEAY